MLNKIINALKSKKSNQHRTQSESTVTSDAQPSKHEADIHASNDDTRGKKSEEELNVPKKTLNRDESSNEVPELTKVRPELRPEGLHGLIGEAALLHISEHSDQSFRDYPITHFGLNRSLI
ncbi:hypothetical protein ACEV9L_25815, partial [Vibrio parahaemolyticus]